jgi:hypothetical protein
MDIMATPAIPTKSEPHVWIFRISTSIWKARRSPFMILPIQNGIGEVELKTGIRVPYPQYLPENVMLEERTGRILIPWTEGTHLDVSELNIDMKSRG